MIIIPIVLILLIVYVVAQEIGKYIDDVKGRD